MKRRIITLCLIFIGSVFSDEVRLKDGSVVKGTVVSNSGSEVEIETSFAGTLKINRDLLTLVSMDNSTEEQGDVPESTGQEVPERSWIYQTSLNLNGSSGNTDKKHLGTEVKAILSGPDDELNLYTLYSSSEENGAKSEDELKGGFRYSSYLNGGPWGLYVREELEKDEFEQIKLRSVTAGGLSVRMANKDHYKLSLHAGFSYRYEKYDDGLSDSKEAGLDFGVHHFYLMESRFKINNDLTYTPLISDFANYLISQNSSLDFPIPGTDLWKVRMGIRSQYNSRPASGRKKLDTTYYTGFVADWN